MGLWELEGRGERDEFRSRPSLPLLSAKLSSLFLPGVTYLIPESFDNSHFFPKMELSSALPTCLLQARCHRRNSVVIRLCCPRFSVVCSLGFKYLRSRDG